MILSNSMPSAFNFSIYSAVSGKLISMNYPTKGFDFVSSLKTKSISVILRSSSGSSSDSSPSPSPSSYSCFFFFFFSSSSHFLSSSSRFCFLVNCWGGVGGLTSYCSSIPSTCSTGGAGGGLFFSKGNPIC